MQFTYRCALVCFKYTSLCLYMESKAASSRKGGGNQFSQTLKGLNQLAWHYMSLGMLRKWRCDVKVWYSACVIPGESHWGVTTFSAHPSWNAVPLVKPQETQQ